MGSISEYIKALEKSKKEYTDQSKGFEILFESIHFKSLSGHQKDYFFERKELCDKFAINIKKEIEDCYGFKLNVQQ